jgi:ketosteroid isomerase-like protein
LLALALVAPAARADTAAGDSADARALIARWVEAQNQGDFAAYQSLYARTFTGVRRSGGRTVNLDREGWMRDRKRMFGKPMKVTVGDLQLSPAGATFTQTFESGRYQDSGKKQLAFAREEGGLRIAREEMLESKLAAPPPDDADTAILRMLYPELDRKTRRIERTEDAPIARSLSVKPRSGADGQSLALVELGQAETEDIELALFIPGTPPKLLGRVREAVDTPSSMSGATYSPACKLDPAYIEIAPGEHAVAVVESLTVHENGPADGSVTRVELVLFRIAGKLPVRVLQTTLVDDTSDAECSSGTRSELSAAAMGRGGKFDLVESRDTEISRYDARGNCNTRHKLTRVRWRFTGGAYAK